MLNSYKYTSLFCLVRGKICYIGYGLPFMVPRCLWSCLDWWISVTIPLTLHLIKKLAHTLLFTFIKELEITSKSRVILDFLTFTLINQLQNSSASLI